MAKLALLLMLLFGPAFASGLFLREQSTALRNARWLSENRLYWFQSYVPDLLELLSRNRSWTHGAGVDPDDDDQAFDPGNVPQYYRVHQELGRLCLNSTAQLQQMNISRQCSYDLQMIVCEGLRFVLAMLRSTIYNCDSIHETFRQPNCRENNDREINRSLWTVKLLDSFGKMAGGTERGDYMFLGDYRQCVQLQLPRTNQTIKGDFEGKYCYATLNAPVSKSRVEVASTCHNRDLSSTCPNSPKAYAVKWGMCAPKSCSILELNLILLNVLRLYNVTVKNPNCTDKPRPLVMCVETPPMDTKAIVMTIIACGIAAVVIAATTYDLVDRGILTREWLGCFPKRKSRASFRSVPSNSNNGAIDETDRRIRPQKQPGAMKQCIIAFSFYTNCYELFDGERNSSSERFRCTDGFRFMSLAWIVLGQCYLISVDFVGNINDLFKLPGITAFQLVNNSSLATDSFLLLSGFLNAYFYLKRSQNVKRNAKGILRHWGILVLKRLIRLWPVYMIIIGLATCFWSYIGEGPMWNSALYNLDAGPYLCQFTWWTNLFFVNNFLLDSLPCLSWTWYVAMDFQLYVFSIPILILYYVRPLAGFLVSLVLVGLSIVLNVIVVISYNLPPSLLATTDLGQYGLVNEYYSKVFIKPYMRWNAVLIGIFLGYAIQRMENRPIRWFMIHQKLVWGLWMAAIGVSTTVVYGASDYAAGLPVASAVVALYSAVNRTVWCCAVATMLFLCLKKHGGIIDWFLSLRIWTPFSRITYSAFLIHALVIAFSYGKAKVPIHTTSLNMIYYWLSTLSMSYGFGLIAYFCLEQPAVKISHVIVNRLLPRCNLANAETSPKLLSQQQQQPQINQTEQSEMTERNTKA